MRSRMIKPNQGTTKLTQFLSEVIAQRLRLIFNRRQRFTRKIRQDSHQTTANNLNLLSRKRRHYSRTELNALFEMPQHRILRFQRHTLLPRVRDLEPKLLPLARRQQKIPVALARQLIRTRLNP